MSTDFRALCAELTKLARRNHYTCEDAWYSCPKSSDGCANDAAGDECDCEADSHNDKIDELLSLAAALAQPEPEPPRPLKERPDFIAGYREGLADRKRITEHEEAERRPAIQPVPVPEPVAYIHRQGDYCEVLEIPLSDDEKARGWTETPLYSRHDLPIPNPANALLTPEATNV
jgi:hypothetical protein